MTGHQSNRPERCGAMRAALSYVQISAASAADHLTAADMPIKALAEIAAYAEKALAADTELSAADQDAFEKHLAERKQADDRGTAEVLCGDRNLCARPYQHTGAHKSFDGDEWGADVAHECGTPAPGTVDTSDYPARMVVLQRDPADPESWIFRCDEGHVSAYGQGGGWQSPDYASEDDALIAAGDHARAMHDMGLPNALAERVAAAEQAAAEQAAAESRPWVKTCSHDGCVMTGRHTHGTMSVA